MRPGSARVTVLSVMVVAALAAPVTAQTLYRWVDENGVVHYSQFPPPAPTAPPSPAPEGKPAAPPEAKPSPPGAKPSLPEAKPAPAGGTKPAPAPDAKERLRFYRRPIGWKAIRVARVPTGEGAATGQRLAQPRQAEFAQRLRDELAREFSP